MALLQPDSFSPQISTTNHNQVAEYGRSFFDNPNYMAGIAFGLLAFGMMYQQYDTRYGSSNPTRFYEQQLLSRIGSSSSPFRKRRQKLRKPSYEGEGMLDSLFSSASSVVSTISSKSLVNNY